MKIKKYIVNILNHFPYIKSLYKFQSDYYKNACYSPGHYYSPIINVDEIKKNTDEIWNKTAVDGIVGINLNVDAQISLINELKNITVISL